MPIKITPELLKQTNEILLFASSDEGKTWQMEYRNKVSFDHVKFNAQSDGRYWLQVLVANREGERSPASNPVLVVVDTKKPEFTLVAGWLKNPDELAVEWAIDELNPDLSTFLLEGSVSGEWQALDVQPAMNGRCNLKPGTTAVRLRIKDLAGNETTSKTSSF
jgi:hypothetical protein